MIVDLENGDRDRVMMVRQLGVIEIRLEGIEGLNVKWVTVVTTPREARKIAVELLWLAEKIEEEEIGS